MLVPMQAVPMFDVWMSCTADVDNHSDWPCFGILFPSHAKSSLQAGCRMSRPTDFFCSTSMMYVTYVRCMLQIRLDYCGVFDDTHRLKAPLVIMCDSINQQKLLTPP